MPIQFMNRYHHRHSSPYRGTPMQLIPIALAQPEMVLAREVVRPDNPSGPPICGRGMVLTASLIARLRQMGVKSLIVEGHPVVIEGEESLEVMLDALEHRFSKVAGDPLMDFLKVTFRSVISRSMGEEAS
jgi:hypothetical protein